MMKKSLLSEEFDMKSRRSVPTMFTRSPRTTVLLGSNFRTPDIGPLFPAFVLVSGIPSRRRK